MDPIIGQALGHYRIDAKVGEGGMGVVYRAFDTHLDPTVAIRILRAETNNIRLNSATGYITPKDMLAGRRQEIHTERDRKLETARKQRQVRRQNAA